MEIKFEILCQLAPAVFLGIHIKSISSKSMLHGIIIGTAVTLFIMFNNHLGMNFPTKPFYFHAGLVGLMLNFLTILIHHKISGKYNNTLTNSQITKYLYNQHFN